MTITETTKYRLIGTAIILFLVAIFLPRLFDGSGRPGNGEEVATSKAEIIPLEQVLQKNAASGAGLITPDTLGSDSEKPVLTKTSEEKTVNTQAVMNQARSPSKDEEGTVVVLDGASLEETASSLDAIMPSTPSAERTSAIKEVSPRLAVSSSYPKNHGDWFVQIGSFSKHKNANSLVNSLIKQGFNAQISKARMADKRVYRVHVGPVMSHRTAEQLRDKIEQGFEVKGMILQLSN